MAMVRQLSDDGDGKDDVRVNVVQQPTNSSDLNIWDIGAFNAHQKEFKRLEAFTNNKQRMMELFDTTEEMLETARDMAIMDLACCLELRLRLPLV